MFSRLLGWFESISPFRIGVVFVAMVLCLGMGLFQKQKISTIFSSGQVVQAQFTTDYRLRPYVTKVKIAGVKVGVVTKVEETDSGQAKVSMKLTDGTAAKLRSEPSAAIRPATLLGGNYYVDLLPAGDPQAFSGVIPLSRTTTPVELDRVLDAFQPTARKSIQKTTAQLDATLDVDGQAAVKKLLADSPDTLKPAATVLTALQGTRPQTDLSTLVTGLESTARALTQDKGQLDAALKNLDTTSGILGRQSIPIANAIQEMPISLRTTRTGLTALDGTLAQLKSTAKTARPTVQKLDTMLEHLQPALTAARPMVHELPATLADLQPIVEQLLPTSQKAIKVLNDVKGPTLERVNGPIVKTILSPWKAKAGSEYDGGGNNVVFFKELGYMIAGMSDSAKMTDRNGSTIHFQPGLGVGSLAGLPVSLEKLFKQTLYPNGSEK